MGNEILLSPLYDALFDKHMIIFKDDVIMEVSAQFTTSLSNLNIDNNLKVYISEGMKKYLRKHREELRK
jgi:putative restriction endonuclease